MSAHSNRVQVGGISGIATGLGLTGLLAAISATQRWVSFTLVGTNTTCIPLLSGGSMHRLLLPAGILLIMAAAGVLVAPGLLRKIIAGFSVAVGAVLVWFAARVMADPLAATTESINRVAGHFTGWLEVATTVTTFWPWVTLIAGLGALVLGLIVIFRPIIRR